ncbi:MAG: hypothetical protein ACRC7V_00810 [Lachnospiraceae bacterium]
MQNQPLPFFMTYPLPISYEECDNKKRDLEYIQQNYPAKAKIYQKEIVKHLNRIDYRGSFIYDEYPDKFLIRQLAGQVLSAIEKENENKIVCNEERLEEIEYIELILMYEIFKKRYENKNNILRFY